MSGGLDTEVNYGGGAQVGEAQTAYVGEAGSLTSNWVQYSGAPLEAPDDVAKLRIELVGS